MRVVYLTVTCTFLFCSLGCGSDIHRTRSNRFLNDSVAKKKSEHKGQEDGSLAIDDSGDKGTYQDSFTDDVDKKNHHASEGTTQDPAFNQPMGEPGYVYVELTQIQGYTPDEVQSILAKSNETCEGPWTFPSYDCFKQQRDRLCGIESDDWVDDLSRLGRCRLPQFGIEAYFDSWTDYDPSLWFTSSGLEKRNWCKDNAKDILKTPSIRDDAVRQCSAQMQQRVRQEKNRHDLVVQCDNLSIRRCHFGGTNSFVDWKGRLKISTPLYLERADELCPREKKRNTVYKACRREEFGREDKNVCRAPETVVYTDANLRKEDLPEAYAYSWQKNPQYLSCTTCDTLPLVTKAQVDAKSDCLIKAVDAYGKMNYQNERNESVAYIQTLALKIQTLFETAKDAPILWKDLVDIKQRQIHSGTDKNIEKQDVEAALCSDLARSHVHPEQIARYFDACVNEPKIFIDQEAWEHSQETLTTGFDLLSNAVVQLRRESQPQPRLEHWIQNHIAQWMKLAMSAVPETDYPTIEIQSASLMRALEKQ